MRRGHQERGGEAVVFDRHDPVATGLDTHLRGVFPDRELLEWRSVR